MRRALTLALVSAPAVAQACPACLGSQTGWTPTLTLLAVFMLFPFVVAFLVIRAIKNADK